MRVSGTHVLLTSNNAILNYKPQLNTVRPDRSKEGHECWTSTLISTLLLGCAEPWEKPQFRLMLEGFTAPLAVEGNITITEVALRLSPCHS